MVNKSKVFKSNDTDVFSVVEQDRYRAEINKLKVDEVYNVQYYRWDWSAEDGDTYEILNFVGRFVEHTRCDELVFDTSELFKSSKVFFYACNIISVAKVLVA